MFITLKYNIFLGRKRGFDYDSPSLNTQCGTYYQIHCRNSTLTNEEEKFIALLVNNDRLPYHLKINESYISEIPAGKFMKLVPITVIDFGGNKIETIQPGAFNGVHDLEELYLQHNKIKVIIRGILNSLVKLRILDVSSNHLENIEESSFIGLTNLENVILNDNQLTQLPQTVFASQKQLKYIDLSENFFMYLPEMVLSNRTEMVTAKLKLSNKSNKGLVNFERNMNINNSYISELNFSLPLSSELINLGYNMINQIQKSKFSGMKHLIKLNLTHNRIEYLLLGTFKDLANLRYLDLSGNFLSEIKFGLFHGLQNLQVLKLNNNKFKQLPGQVFLDLPHLTDLDISGNDLPTSMIEDIGDHLKYLKKVSISNNSPCQKLVRLIKKMQSSGVQVSKGMTYEDTNVHGIACKMYTNFEEENYSNKTESYGSPNYTVYSYNEENNMAKFSKKLHNVDEEFKGLLKLNENSYTTFFVLLACFLALQTITVVLLYKLYMFIKRRKGDVYKVKFNKENNSECNNDMVTI